MPTPTIEKPALATPFNVIDGERVPSDDKRSGTSPPPSAQEHDLSILHKWQEDVMRHLSETQTNPRVNTSTEHVRGLFTALREVAPTEGSGGDIAKIFQDLTQSWRISTRTTSSSTKSAMDPSYQKIIGMGAVVLPLIIKDLEKSYDHWFWALESITRNPTPSEFHGNIPKMREYWLEYAKVHNLI
jgi:hypothetical protein